MNSIIQKINIRTFCFILLQTLFSISALESNAQYRPPLFFREDWKENPAAHPITQEHVANPDLILGLYGPGRDLIRKSHHDKPADDPFYVWSGYCKGNWAVTLKHQDFYADLSGFAKIRRRSEQAGFRNLHIILKLADGTWLVSNQAAGASKDWQNFEFNIQELKWFDLDIKNITEGKSIDSPDLSKVDEIGFTDLMTGGSGNASSRLDWIEVDGKQVKRN
jgi:hypothetical protein